MRISDWSSDVCSSDLVEIAQEAFLVVLQQDKCSGDWVFGIGEAQQPPPWWFCRESRNTRRSDLPNSQLPIPNPGSKGTSMRWFEIALVVLTLISGLVWLLENLFLAKRRAANPGLLDAGTEPWYVDYAKAFFPVLAIVLVLLSFVSDPFHLPSHPMTPPPRP